MRTAGLRLDHAPQLDLPLRFFLTAPLFGVAAGALLALRGAALLHSPWLPGTIALAHLITLGLLTMTMLGALHQILPVVVGTEVPGARWSRWLQPLFALAVVLLAGGLLLGLPSVIATAMVLLAASLLPLLAQQAWGLLRAPGQGPTVQLLWLALAAFAGTIGLGLLFAAGHALGWWPLARTAALPVHLFWGLGGWVGGLIAGVAIAVLPMFYIAPPVSPRAARALLATLGAMLVTAPPATFLGAARAWLLLPLGCGAAALVVFTVALLRLLRARRRKVTDVSLRYWQGGLVAAWLSVALLLLWVVWPQPCWLLAFGVLYLLGFAGAVLSGMLYKIVPFLVWTHRFSRMAGRGPMPMMGDLLPRRQAQRQQMAYGLAVLLLAAATLFPAEWLVRVAGLALAVASGWLWVNLLRAARFQPPAAEPETGRLPQAARAHLG